LCIGWKNVDENALKKKYLDGDGPFLGMHENDIHYAEDSKRKIRLLYKGPPRKYTDPREQGMLLFAGVGVDSYSYV
jgi:hypothetical protein